MFKSSKLTILMVLIGLSFTFLIKTSITQADIPAPPITTSKEQIVNKTFTDKKKEKPAYLDINKISVKYNKAGAGNIIITTRGNLNRKKNKDNYAFYNVFIKADKKVYSFDVFDFDDTKDDVFLKKGNTGTVDILDLIMIKKKSFNIKFVLPDLGSAKKVSITVYSGDNNRKTKKITKKLK